MRVYIFGASIEGERCYDEIKKYCKVKGFVDNCCDQWGKEIRDGIITYPPQVLEEKNEYDVVVVADMHYYDIMNQLKKKEISNFILPPISPEDFEHPNFILYLEYSKKAYDFYKKVYTVQGEKDALSIGDYNKGYFMNITLRDFYLYGEILWNVYKYHGVPESLLVCGERIGLLGMYAKYIGVKNVYYNNPNDISCQDANEITKGVGIDLDDYIYGDFDEVLKYSILNNRYFDAIIMIGTKEYIYGNGEYFRKIISICKRDCFVSIWTEVSSYNNEIEQQIGAKHYMDFDALLNKIQSFENAFIIPENKKETSNVIGFCFQNKAYPYILEEWLDEEEKHLYRYRLYYQILINWLKKITLGHKVENWFLKKNIHKIIIYGGGELGRILYDQLQTENRVIVDAVCDRNISGLDQYFINTKIISVDELSQKYNQNTIVVTPIYAYDAIYREIRKKVKGNIIDLSVIIKEM